MTGSVNWETVNALIEATAEAREVIREAHEVTKDLRREIAEAKAVIARDTAKEIEAAVADQLAALGEQTRKAMDASVAKVGKEIDRLMMISLGTDRQSRREGKPPVEELIRRAAP